MASACASVGRLLSSLTGTVRLAAVQEDHLVLHAAAQLGIARHDGVLLRLRLLPLLLRLCRPGLHGGHDLILEGLLHPLADGPPGETERHAEDRAADVFRDVVAEVEVIAAAAAVPVPAAAELAVGTLDVVVVVVAIVAAEPWGCPWFQPWGCPSTAETQLCGALEGLLARAVHHVEKLAGCADLIAAAALRAH